MLRLIALVFQELAWVPFGMPYVLLNNVNGICRSVFMLIFAHAKCPLPHWGGVLLCIGCFAGIMTMPFPKE